MPVLFWTKTSTLSITLIFFPLISLAELHCSFSLPNRAFPDLNAASHAAVKPLHLMHAAEHTGEGMKMAHLFIYCFEVWCLAPRVRSGSNLLCLWSGPFHFSTRFNFNSIIFYLGLFKIAFKGEKWEMDLSRNLKMPCSPGEIAGFNKEQDLEEYQLWLKKKIKTLRFWVFPNLLMKRGDFAQGTNPVQQRLLYQQHKINHPCAPLGGIKTQQNVAVASLLLIYFLLK